ncbi:MAG: hydroxyacylglutathione hydrolase [Endozoicomonadaceae bacterium]|nr:hydroxyacylglutathione hydrolase [Endozoicomonadaceae bacterium]
MVKIDPVSAFSDNYIWMITDKFRNTTYAVDPGEALPVERYCQKNKVRLVGILITHHHYDHTGGVDELTNNHNIPVYGPLGSHPKITHVLKKNDNLALPAGTFKVIAVPGHTLDHIAYFSDTLLKQPVLFIGDTLFSSGCGRIFEGNAEIMYNSVHYIRNNLHDSTLLFCAHEYTQNNLKFALCVEPSNLHLQQRIREVQQLREKNLPSVPTSLQAEKKINPFLRTEQHDIIKNCSAWCGKQLSSEISVFATLRQWKDGF